MGAALKHEPQVTLYSLTEDFARLIRMAEDGEIDEQTLNDTIDATLADATAEKLEGYAHVWRNTEAKAKMLKSVADEWKAKAQSAENALKKIKERIKLHMETRKADVVEAGSFTFALQGNGGIQELEIDEGVDPVKVPKRFRKTIVDTDAVRAFLSEPKAKLKWARLLPRGKHVRLR